MIDGFVRNLVLGRNRSEGTAPALMLRVEIGAQMRSAKTIVAERTFVFLVDAPVRFEFLVFTRPKHYRFNIERNLFVAEPGL
jgi:hypothetical protein